MISLTIFLYHGREYHPIKNLSQNYQPIKNIYKVPQVEKSAQPKTIYTSI